MDQLIFDGKPVSKVRIGQLMGTWTAYADRGAGLGEDKIISAEGKEALLEAAREDPEISPALFGAIETGVSKAVFA